MPTVSKFDSHGGGESQLSQQRLPMVELVGRLPTPRVEDNHPGNAPESKRPRGVGMALRDAVRMPTLDAMIHRLPTVRAASETGGGCGLDGGSGSRSALTEQERRELTSRHLNPEWVEWFMGWPLGFTSLEPMPAGAFADWLAKQQAHGECSPWWGEEPPVPRTLRVKNGPKRVAACGDGQVPACAAMAWRML